MINKYKNADNELKEYKASKVSTGSAKNGKPYTVFNIADAKQVGGEWKYDNYTIFSWQPNLQIENGDKVTFDEITALEVKEEEYNGEMRLKKTIFANVKVIKKEPENKTIDIIDDLQPLDPNDDTLPF
ncbi:MAG: hypothetical protein ACI4PF_02400 [Christensenellales bacterium]